MAQLKVPAVDASFVASTAQKSLPSLTRPRLNTESEARLAEVDRKDAAKYASMETLTHQFHLVADAMDADQEDERERSIRPNDRAIPEEGEWEDSMVHNIEETRARLIAK